MKASRTTAGDVELLDPFSRLWRTGRALTVALAPTPLLPEVSPYMTVSGGTHGKIRRMEARAIHNGNSIGILLSWRDASRDDSITDLDQFADGGAVMFPLKGGNASIMMGDEQRPVNAWFWKADLAEPFDVIARGPGKSRRRPAASSGLSSAAVYRDGKWRVVFRRSLSSRAEEFVDFAPGRTVRIAFAAWEGGNAERGGLKSYSERFFELELEA